MGAGHKAYLTRLRNQRAGKKPKGAKKRGSKGAGHKAWLTRQRNVKRKGKGKGQVVGFYKDHGKTKPITKPIAQLKRKRVVAGGKKFGGIKPKKEKWMQKAKESGHVKKGALIKYGYDANSSPEARHKALTTCVNAEGFQVCRSRVQMLVNVAPNGSRLDKIYKQDLTFLDGMKAERGQRWKKILKKASASKPKSGYTIVGTFASSSTPGKKYTVLQGPKGGLSCNCAAWIFKKRDQSRTCRHVKEVEARLRKK